MGSLAVVECDRRFIVQLQNRPWLEKSVLTYRSLTCTLFRTFLAFHTLPCPRSAVHHSPPPDVCQQARQDSLLDCVPGIALSIPSVVTHHIRDTTTTTIITTTTISTIISTKFTQQKNQAKGKRDNWTTEGKRSELRRLHKIRGNTVRTCTEFDNRSRIIRRSSLGGLEFIFHVPAHHAALHPLSISPRVRQQSPLSPDNQERARPTPVEVLTRRENGELAWRLAVVGVLP
jgi:hypothetical protein